MKRRLRSPCESCQPVSPTSVKQPARHAVEQIAEPEPPAHVFGELEILGTRRPAPAHEQIEGEALGEHMILVELRGGHHAPAPGRPAPSVARSSPSSSSTPDEGVRRPVSSETSVDFPLPDGPER